jgi:hypothetical protein
VVESGPGATDRLRRSCAYISGHDPTKKKFKSWRVSILRQRAQYIGTVKAPDARAAEAAAVAQFKLDVEQRKRLAVREEE